MQNYTLDNNFKVMSANISLTGNHVKNGEVAKIEKILKVFNVNEQKSFLSFCKQSSEIDFRSKIFQISDGSNKLGKSKLCVSSNIFIYIVFYK